MEQAGWGRLRGRLLDAEGSGLGTLKGWSRVVSRLISVFLGFCNRNPQSGWLSSNRNVYLTVLEPEVQGKGASSPVLMKDLLLAQSQHLVPLFSEGKGHSLGEERKIRLKSIWPMRYGQSIWSYATWSECRCAADRHLHNQAAPRHSRLLQHHRLWGRDFSMAHPGDTGVLPRKHRPNTSAQISSSSKLSPFPLLLWTRYQFTSRVCHDVHAETRQIKAVSGVHKGLAPPSLCPEAGPASSRRVQR